MAFRTLIQGGQAKVIEPKGAKVEGYLMSAQCNIGKFESTIYTIQTADGPVKVWGNAGIDSVLLNGDDKKKALHPSVASRLIRITCTDEREVKKGKSVKVYRDHKVEVDLSKKWNRADKE